MKIVDKFDKRTGFRLVAETEKNEEIKGMINFKGKILVATTKGVFCVNEKKLTERRKSNA